MLAQQKDATLLHFGDIEPPKQDGGNDSGGEDPQVGILAFEVRNEMLYQANAVYYRYHTACFHKAYLQKTWYMERATIILLSEAKKHEWRCARQECGKPLIEPPF